MFEPDKLNERGDPFWSVATTFDSTEDSRGTCTALEVEFTFSPWVMYAEPSA